MMTNDPELLREFSRNHSEEAFRALVRQHSAVVYSAALRKLNGDRAAAQDVTQEVFTLLVRKASRLEGVVLSGWLYRQACRRASNHVRSESRRKLREQAAMETMENSAPDHSSAASNLARELDDAMLHLSDSDRDALVLRFFEGREYQGVGKALGLGEEAARKRVRRALDKLAVVFKRKGIVVSGVSLGTAMEGFGATPVPASMVSQISTAALKAAPAGGVGTAALVKPLIAGVIATSLVAGSTLALRTQPEKGAAVTPPPSSSRSGRDARTARLTDNLPENPTLEQIIAEIRRIRSVPGNSLTAMRMNVTLGKIGFERIPAFIALGNISLTKIERDAVYRELMGMWANREPEAAISFILGGNVDAGVGKTDGSGLLQLCFGLWKDHDPGASGEWLLRNWNHETLAKGVSVGMVRNLFSLLIAGKLFASQGAAAALDFASRLPTAVDQAKAFQSLMSVNQPDAMWSYSDEYKDQWRDLYLGIEKLPDAYWRRELARAFWERVGVNQPADFERIKNFIGPSDPFAAALGLLSVRSMTPWKSGSNDVRDRDRREAAAMAAGMAAGLSRGETLAAVGKTLSTVLPEHDFLVWFDSHRDGANFDDLLMAGKLSYNGNSILWMSRISDADLRRAACRGVFRRMLASSKEWAERYLSSPNIPADLAPEFHEIMNETP